MLKLGSDTVVKLTNISVVVVVVVVVAVLLHPTSSLPGSLAVNIEYVRTYVRTYR